jgi:hypothetical protein
MELTPYASYGAGVRWSLSWKLTVSVYLYVSRLLECVRGKSTHTGQ